MGLEPIGVGTASIVGTQSKNRLLEHPDNVGARDECDVFIR